jgi:hypothetical protein
MNPTSHNLILMDRESLARKIENDNEFLFYKCDRCKLIFYKRLYNVLDGFEGFYPNLRNEDIFGEECVYDAVNLTCNEFIIKYILK